MSINLGILLVLIILLILSIIGMFVPLQQCVSSKELSKESSKELSEIILDIQYSEDNNPSKVYKDMFNFDSYVSGYNLDDDKTYTVKEVK